MKPPTRKRSSPSSPERAPLVVTALAARRFQLAALGLAQPHADVASALAHHGFVQIDPINVCGRMHDLILRPRVAGYREGDLFRHTHGTANGDGAAPLAAEQRTAFEHHLPSTGVLAVFGLEAWPHLLEIMEARTRRAGAWSGRLTPREKALAPRLLDAIGERGPLSSEEFADTGRARAVWGSATLAKSTLQKLFFHGRLLIAQRDPAGRRRYDLPARVLPAAVLAQPAAEAGETARWLALLKLRQRRLCVLTRAELTAAADAVQPVRVTDANGPLLHCLRTDAPLWEDIEPAPPASFTRLLAPLDPLIYDRRVTRALWGFDYTWEVYTPPAKRVRGYYALPVLHGTELAGHVDPKADRPAGRLRVMSRRVKRGVAASPAVRELAHWLGLK